MRKKVSKYALKVSDIGNMDVVPISFGIPASRSADYIGVNLSPVITIGNEKNSFTVILACLASEYKLLQIVEFKKKTFPKEDFSKGIIVLQMIKAG